MKSLSVESQHLVESQHRSTHPTGSLDFPPHSEVDRAPCRPSADVAHSDPLVSDSAIRAFIQPYGIEVGVASTFWGWQIQIGG
ncbi:MAG: hypothetical protein MUF72_05235 [Elainella sp. Prado103]|jgi:hypothetical protein|nr:hypothetical protein [Elainella sp. Prado103]